MPKAWSLIVSRYKSETLSVCHDNVVKWIKYHKGFWVKSGIFIKEWNFYRQLISTNNLLECRNALLKSRVGDSWIKKIAYFVQNLCKCFCDGFLECEQYVKHGMVWWQHKQKILKNMVLIEWWKFQWWPSKQWWCFSFLKDTSQQWKQMLMFDTNCWDKFVLYCIVSQNFWLSKCYQGNLWNISRSLDILNILKTLRYIFKCHQNI